MLVSLKSGEVYIVDLSGAQFGYHEPVLAVNNYFEMRAEAMGRVLPFGHQRQDFQEASKKGFTWASAIRAANEIMYEGFNDFVSKWEKLAMRLNTMLKLQDRAFIEKQKSLVLSVKRLMEKYKVYATQEGYCTVEKTLVPPETKEPTFKQAIEQDTKQDVEQDVANLLET